MQSAFGIEHTEIAKARRGPGVTRTRRNLAISMIERGPSKSKVQGSYYHPSAEQVAASKARRGKQAEYSVHHKVNIKPNIPVGGGRKVPLHVAMNEVGELKGLNRTVRNRTLAGVGLLGGVYGANKLRQQVSKSMDRRQAENAGMAAASGAAGGLGGKLIADAGLNMGGQLGKAKLKQRRYMRGESPNERKVWLAHKTKYPDPTQRHLNYPKSLPDWKMHRALAVKNTRAFGRGARVAGAAAGAGAGLAIAHHMRRQQ